MPKTEGKHTEQIWQRVDAVVNLILENDKYLKPNRKTELSKIVAKKFDVSKRTAERYLKEARKEVLALGKSDKKKAFQKCSRRIELLFNKALNMKNDNGEHLPAALKLAREINVDYAKLNQLLVDEVKHSGEVDIRNINLASLSDDQVIKLSTLLKNKVPVKDALLHVGVIIK